MRRLRRDFDWVSPDTRAGDTDIDCPAWVDSSVGLDLRPRRPSDGSLNRTQNEKRRAGTKCRPVFYCYDLKVEPFPTSGCGVEPTGGIRRAQTVLPKQQRLHWAPEFRAWSTSGSRCPN
jgi:hypothetical protein